MRKVIEAQRSLRTTRRLVNEVLRARDDPDALARTDRAFEEIAQVVGIPTGSIAPGEWVVRTIDTFSEDELERTKFGK